MESVQVSLAHGLDDLVRRLGGRRLAELWICSAYIRMDGVGAITPLLKARSIRAVLGAGDQTDPAAVKALVDRHADVRLRRHTVRKEFHPKCYVGLEANGRAWAAVGSANLTGGGAGRNVELMTLVEGQATDPYFVSLLAWLKGQHRMGLAPTKAIMESVRVLFETGGQVTQAQQAAARRLDQVCAQEEAKRERRSMVTYIQKTRLLTSYKLVILGLLLQEPDGCLRLEECAARFQAFYQAMEREGIPPERRLRGFRQPTMSEPLEHDRKRVVRLLEGRIGSTITKRGFVRYRVSTEGTELVAGVRLSVEERLEALEALVERLSEYYRERVGAVRMEGVIRQALSPAAKSLGA